jgi:hypothetical protein
MGVGLIATMAALVLGLLIASAKLSLETQNSELTDVSSRIVLLDRVLAHFGPETKAARDQLHSSVVLALELVSAREIADQSRPGSFTNGEAMYDEIQALSPKDDAQRSIQGQALSIATGLLQTRWLIAEQRVNSVSLPLLVVLIFLACHHLHRLRLVRPSQWDRGRQPVRLRAFSFCGNFLDSGDVLALRGIDSGLECPSPLRAYTSRPVVSVCMNCAGKAQSPD